MIDPKCMKKWALSSALAGIVLTAPMTTYAALGDQTLKQGMNHDDVKQLQDVLKNKGYFTYSTSTGYFGSITKDAVMQFQRKQKLSVDGIVGPETFKALNVKSVPASSKEQTKSQSTVNTNQLLRVGSRGQAVTDLQNKLKNAGLYTYTVDGIYGSITAQAVRQFQQKNGLLVDGIAGPQTLAALNNAKADAPPKQTTPKPPKESSTGSTLRLGAKGAAVTELQNKLKAAGAFPYTVDGIFGQQTLSAVRNFQLQQGLAVDGIVGPQTWAKLQSPSKPGTSKPGNSAGFNVIQLVADAGSLSGTPYVWGGTTPSGFDCSGFLVYVFNKQGVKLPRTVAQQWNAGKKVSKPSVGDVVFFETYQKGPSHNGIYVGNNQFIHAGSSTGVTVSNLNSSYWQSRYLGAKQLY